MAVKTKSRRYRRIRVRRPFYQVVRRFVVPTDKGREEALPLSDELPQEVVEPVTTKAVEPGCLASFEPEYNPYAYMVSQLPNMLGSIPDLVYLGGEKIESKTEPQGLDQSIEQKTKSVTEQSTIVEAGEVDMSVQEKAGVAKGDEIEPETSAKALEEPVDDICEVKQEVLSQDVVEASSDSDSMVKPSELWLGWQTSSEFVTRLVRRLKSWCQPQRDFPWPGLPEQSCRLKRYGGEGYVAESLRPMQPRNEGVMASMARLQNQLDGRAEWLFLRLSAPDAVAQLLLSGPADYCVEPFHHHVDYAFGELETKAYFDSLFAQGHLTVADDWPLKLLDEPLVELKDLNVGELQALLRLQRDSPERIVLNIKNQQFNIYVELLSGQAELLTWAHRRTVFKQTVFIDELIRLLDDHRCQMPFEARTFAPPNTRQLPQAMQLESREAFWQQPLAQPLLQFVTSSYKQHKFSRVNRLNAQ